MSKKAFAKILNGLEDAKAYMGGTRKGYKVTVPSTIDVKSIRKSLNMTQSAFSDNFGFSLDTVKHWEGGRRTPETPARAYLIVIQNNPTAVMDALAVQSSKYKPKRVLKTKLTSRRKLETKSQALPEKIKSKSTTFHPNGLQRVRAKAPAYRRA